MLDFELLIYSIKQGDKNAFRQLFKEYYSPLCFFALKFMRDEQLSEDIVQEVMYDLWSRRKNIDIKTSLKSFLYICVRNKCLTYLSKNPLNSKSLSDTDLDTEITEDYNSIEEEVLANLYKAINSLPEKSREVLILSMQGMSNTEIAEKMDVSINTVKSNKKRAYDFIRKLLGDFFKKDQN
ncbi:MAG: RNA polymerase sigma factor [Mangrovibacterium sp.]